VKTYVDLQVATGFLRVLREKTLSRARCRICTAQKKKREEKIIKTKMHKMVNFFFLIRNDISSPIILACVIWHGDKIYENGNCDFN
jgi:hypothetical protein